MSKTVVTQTRRERVADKERAILTAAREIFICNGLDGARMAEIAKRAGIAEGTIYLYFKTKSDLMNALLAEYWDDLTRGARAILKSNKTPTDQLYALADYHLSSLVADFDFMNLTTVMRGAERQKQISLDEIRKYVAVFDDIFRRGIDRGDFVLDAPLWVARDVFYGTFEYSSRTMRLHNETDVKPVVKNMMEIFLSTYGAAKMPAKGVEQDDLGGLVDRLERAVCKLENS